MLADRILDDESHLDSLSIDVSLGDTPVVMPNNNQNDIFEVINTKETVKLLKESGVSFKFELMNVVTGEIAILYFNAMDGKSGCKVKLNSKFAKLYRLTIGENPRKRYSKAHQLRSHFIGKKLRCKTESAQYSNGDFYNRVTHAEPLIPIVKNEWTSTGILKGRNRSRGNISVFEEKNKAHESINGNLSETDRNQDGNELEKSRRKDGNVNRALDLVNTRCEGLSIAQITDNKSTANRKTVQLAGIDDIDSREHQVPNQFNGFNFRSKQTETQDDYFERVLNETF